MIEIQLKGDKSLSHRYLIFEYLSKSHCHIENLSHCADVKTTHHILNNINKIKLNTSGTLDCGNSGTTMRLLAGVFAGQNIECTLIGDESLSSRPMQRITEPLNSLGANVNASNDKSPLRIQKSQRNNKLEYELSIPSAQVKSSLLLYALTTNSALKLTGRIDSRDHTEIFLKYIGLPITISSSEILLKKNHNLILPFDVFVPGDISSAAFLIVARLMKTGPDLKLTRISLNESRIRFITILQEIGFEIKIENTTFQCGEKIGDIICTYKDLKLIKKPTEISSADTPHLIDELPILSLLFSQIPGSITIKELSELRIKESDRLESIKNLLNSVTKNVITEITKQDQLIIKSSSPELVKAKFNSKDHRLLMSYYVSQFILQDSFQIPEQDNRNISISYPGFLSDMKKLLSSHKEDD